MLTGLCFSKVVPLSGKYRSCWPSAHDCDKNRGSCHAWHNVISFVTTARSKPLLPTAEYSTMLVCTIYYWINMEAFIAGTCVQTVVIVLLCHQHSLYRMPYHQHWPCCHQQCPSSQLALWQSAVTPESGWPLLSGATNAGQAADKQGIVLAQLIRYIHWGFAGDPREGFRGVQLGGGGMPW